MEYANHLNEYAPAWSAAQVDQEVTRIREAAKRNHNTDVYKMCYSAIDLTTLSCNDSVTSVTEFARKAAGGVRTAEDGALYYTIVEEILGKEWLTTDLFRIGASSAANNILSAIEGREIKYF